jgi:hypothetical protein
MIEVTIDLLHDQERRTQDVEEGNHWAEPRLTFLDALPHHARQPKGEEDSVVLEEQPPDIEVVSGCLGGFAGH